MTCAALLALTLGGCLTPGWLPGGDAEPYECPHVSAELPDPRHTLVTGQVVTPEGAPLADARVTAVGEGDARREAHVGTGGCWWTVLPWGAWTLTAEAEGREAGSRTLELSGDRVDGVDFALPARGG